MGLETFFSIELQVLIEISQVFWASIGISFIQQCHLEPILTPHAQSLLLCFIIATYTAASIIFLLGSLRASTVIHNRLARSLLGTTLRWLDSTPTGRVVARFTQDLRVIDGPIILCLNKFLREFSLSLYVPKYN